jgi:hypothetical protein
MLLSFFYSSRVIAQYAISPDAVALDSAAIAESRDIQDSLSKEYIFVSDTRPNLKLDSLWAQVTVEGNDFVGWMQRMDVLRGEHTHHETQIARYKTTRPNWVVGVLMFLVLGIGVIRFFFRSMFHRVVYAYYNEQATQDISKEDSVATSWPYIFLYLLFSLSLGLFLLIYISAFGGGGLLTLQNFFSLSAFLAILFVVKIMLIRLLGSIFELQRTAREYIAVLYLMYFNSMLILMPFLVLVTFLPVFYFKFLLILFAVVVSALFIYKFSVTAFRLLGQLKFSIFYLILYLCALEIAPILILVKALNS